LLILLGASGRSVGEAFSGWLMSDGYQAYRPYRKRLRCWAHLVRKARGLEESLVKSSQRFGKQTVDLQHALMQAVYEAREGPSEDLKAKRQRQLDAFRLCCKRCQDAEHDEARQLTREFLNDWDAIFAALSHPQLPSQTTKRSAQCGIGSFYASSALTPEANKVAARWRCWPASSTPVANAGYPHGRLWPKSFTFTDNEMPRFRSRQPPKR
jgi:hypothetical protein